MTPEEFRAELAALGVTQTWLADRLKVKRQVVSRWANNGSGSPVPSWMPFLLELLRERRQYGWVADYINSPSFQRLQKQMVADAAELAEIDAQIEADRQMWREKGIILAVSARETRQR